MAQHGPKKPKRFSSTESPIDCGKRPRGQVLRAALFGTRIGQILTVFADFPPADEHAVLPRARKRLARELNVLATVAVVRHLNNQPHVGYIRLYCRKWRIRTMSRYVSHMGGLTMLLTAIG
jgi:hypothetical protein